MSKEYNIGIYIRLSMADEDTGYGSKAESDSIGNQRMFFIQTPLTEPFSREGRPPAMEKPPLLT